MTSNLANVQYFLSLSERYFRLTEKTVNDVSVDELIEFLEAINNSSPPVSSLDQ